MAWRCSLSFVSNPCYCNLSNSSRVFLEGVNATLCTFQWCVCGVLFSRVIFSRLCYFSLATYAIHFLLSFVYVLHLVLPITLQTIACLPSWVVGAVLMAALMALRMEVLKLVVVVILILVLVVEMVEVRVRWWLLVFVVMAVMVLLFLSLKKTSKKKKRN